MPVAVCLSNPRCAGSWKAFTIRSNPIDLRHRFRYILSVHTTCQGCPENVDFSAVFRGPRRGTENPSLSAKNSRNLRTCAGMRRRQKSYSLGNLCDIYQIDLKEHHRALCDAKAAAQLLNLVNQKREAARPAVLEHAASLAARVW
jgi:hypothetical protein